jgi:hypothetical protein
MKPAPDVSTAFGALKSKRKFTSIKEETEAAEKAIASENIPTGRDGSGVMATLVHMCRLSQGRSV